MEVRYDGWPVSLAHENDVSMDRVAPLYHHTQLRKCWVDWTSKNEWWPAFVSVS